MNGYLLDTHIIIWELEGKKKISEKVRSILAQSRKHAIFISPVTFWEMGILLKKDQLTLHVSFDDLLDVVMKNFHATELPLTTDIVRAAYYLPFDHSDPADRFIAATAFEHDLTLLTMDKMLIGHEWLKTLS